MDRARKIGFTQIYAQPFLKNLPEAPFGIIPRKSAAFVRFEPDNIT
jgi:hypothetical protein